jgi:hypothetical protein
VFIYHHYLRPAGGEGLFFIFFIFLPEKLSMGFGIMIEKVAGHEGN